MNTRRTFFRIHYSIILLVTALVCITMVSCRTAGEKAQIQVAKAKEQKRKEGYREYKKAFKRHLENQSKDTRKRIKKQLRAKKKEYRQQGMKGRYKPACIPD
ncbi:MAG: hypothetical protein J5701_08680 [Bacteroidales bacterium]|nr:hypothetical protein [Bacteroidales bacterium]